jgi:hypothetical protein
MLRAYSLTLIFASTIEVLAIVDLDLDIDNLGAPRTLIFVAGNDMIMSESPQ